MFVVIVTHKLRWYNKHGLQLEQCITELRDMAHRAVTRAAGQVELWAPPAQQKHPHGMSAALRNLPLSAVLLAQEILSALASQPPPRLLRAAGGLRRLRALQQRWRGAREPHAYGASIVLAAAAAALAQHCLQPPF